MNIGVPVFSPTKPLAKKPKYISLMSKRRDGKFTTMMEAQARKGLHCALTAPKAVPDHDLARRAILAQREMELAVFKETSIPYPERDEPQYVAPFGSDGYDDFGGCDPGPGEQGRISDGAEDDGYDGDSDDSDGYETHQFKDAKEAVNQFIQTSESLSVSHKWRKHSENKEKRQIAWDNFIVTATKLFTTTSFLLSNTCGCSSSTMMLPVVGFAGKYLHHDKANGSGCRLEEFISCDENCPFKNAMPGLLQKRCYPSTPQRPAFAFEEDVIKFFARMYFKGPSSKVNFCNTITSLIQEESLFSFNPAERDWV
jgi:hypothetical protein